jgi:hypothetical protein
MPISRSQKKRNAEPRQKQKHRCLVIDPMVNPGSSAHRHQARSKANPTRPHHRMVTLAQSSPGDRSAFAPQSKTTTVILGRRATKVSWIVADVTRWEPPQLYDVWHDRATFHFLTNAADRSAYVDRLRKALRPGGTAIIGTFAMDGPERCSGLPVVRYDATGLAAILGGSFVLVETRRHDHVTLMGSTQRFQFSVFGRK